MFDAEAMTERHGLILAELAEIGMAIVRELKVQALEAEAPEAQARAVAAFPRVARAVRQSLALEARLQRDLIHHRRETARDADREIQLLMRKRKARVRLYMERAIADAFAEADDTGDAVMMRLEDLRERLHDDLLEPDFAVLPFPEAIALLHRALGMDPPELGPEDDPFSDDPEGGPDDGPGEPDCGDPPSDDAPTEPDFRYSSA